MSFTVELSSNAASDLQSLDDSLKGHVVDQLYELAQNPLTKSRPVVSPPYRPGGQMYEFQIADSSDPNLIHRFVIIFIYSQDETSIQIAAIGHHLLRNP